jgi:hypothetical protein
VPAIVLGHLFEKGLLYCSDILLLDLWYARFLVHREHVLIHLLKIHQSCRFHHDCFLPYHDLCRPFPYQNLLSGSGTIAESLAMKLLAAEEVEVGI